MKGRLTCNKIVEGEKEMRGEGKLAVKRTEDPGLERRKGDAEGQSCFEVAPSNRASGVWANRPGHSMLGRRAKAHTHLALHSSGPSCLASAEEKGRRYEWKDVGRRRRKPRSQPAESERMEEVVKPEGAKHVQPSFF